ncbi:MAG: ATP-binding protein [Thermoplasmata archaeon]|nr:ATP-binding protein [Thermoplasmata archaeon]
MATIRVRTSEQDVEVGEILVAEAGDARYLLRVVNVEYGIEGGSEEWADRAAGTMMVMDRRGQEMRLQDGERRLYCSLSCALLGKVDGSFRRAKSLPPHFATVRRADAGDLSVLQDSMGPLRLGWLRSGSRALDIDVGISPDELPYHVGVFATTGMGKSNLMKVLAASVMVSGGCGLLILDPHGEYFDGGASGKGLRDHPARDRLVVYSSRPLAGPHRRVTISAREVEVEDLMNIYTFSSAQRDAFQSARRVYRDGWLVSLLRKEVPELVSELHGTQDVSLHVIRRRLMNLFRSNILTEDPSISMARGVHQALAEGKVVLVDTSALGETEELLVSVVLARAILERNRDLYLDQENFRRQPPMLISIEEAQRVLYRPEEGRARNIFAEIAREGRKFGTGLCAISQQPKLIDPEVISQFNTHVILGLSDRRDREILRDSTKQDISPLTAEIQTLMAGEAVLTSPTRPFPIPLKVPLFDDVLDAAASAPVGRGPLIDRDFL